MKNKQKAEFTLSAPTTVSWCFLTASAENSELDIKQRPSKARYLGEKEFINHYIGMGT